MVWFGLRFRLDLRSLMLALIVVFEVFDYVVVNFIFFIDFLLKKAAVTPRVISCEVEA